MNSGASLDVDKLRNELKATCTALGIAQQEATKARGEKATAEVVVQNLLVDVTATCDAAFPVQAADNPVAAEEHLRDLPARLRAVVSEAVRQGAAIALAAAQL